MGNNISGALNKRDSLLYNLQKFSIGVFCLQETKLSRKGMIKIPNYVLFEAIRHEKEGGSLMTGVHTNLSPVLIFEDTQLEILVVQIRIQNASIRIVNAYGPQENVRREKILSFYSVLDQIVQNAKMDSCLILLQLDANA